MNCFSGDITRVLKDQIVWLTANDGDLIYIFQSESRKQIIEDQNSELHGKEMNVIKR